MVEYSRSVDIDTYWTRTRYLNLSVRATELLIVCSKLHKEMKASKTLLGPSQNEVENRRKIEDKNPKAEAKSLGGQVMIVVGGKHTQ